MIKILIFLDHVPPNSSPVWLLLGAGRLLDGLFPRARAGVRDYSCGLRDASHKAQFNNAASPFICRTSTVYPDQGNRYWAGFWKKLNKSKLPGQRQSNSG